MIFGVGPAGLLDYSSSLTINNVTTPVGGGTQVYFTAAHGYDSAEDKLILISGANGWSGLNGLHRVIESLSTTSFRLDIYNPGTWTSGGTCRVGEQLNHNSIKPSWEEPDDIKHKSINNGTINVYSLGEYSSFIINMKLYSTKYSDAGAKLNQLKLYKNKSFVFYPHIDGSVLGDCNGISMRNSSNNEVLYHLDYIKPYYIEDSNYYDEAEIKVSSKGYTDFTKVIQ